MAFVFVFFLKHIHNQYDDPIEASKMDDAISKFQELIKEITSDLGTTQHGLGPSLASNVNKIQNVRF